MRVIEPSYEIEPIDGLGILKKLEKAGRTCYKSEDKITDESASKFVVRIIKSGHESVLEHEKVSVRVICDRGVSHEIVRHRIGSYSQESTRYCNYADGVTFVKPPWVELADNFVLGHNYDNGLYPYSPSNITSCSWLKCMLRIEETYLNLLSSGWSPQQARSVLPNSLKTELVMTFNLRQWRHFFKLRTSKAAHPQMREITVPMLKEFKEKLPVIFDDVKLNYAGETRTHKDASLKVFKISAYIKNNP